MRSQTSGQLDALLAEYRLLAAQVRRMQDDVSSLTATGRSADGCARATVNAWGELTELTFDPSAARRLEPTALAARVLEAAGSAAAEVRREKAALMATLLPARLRDLMGDDGAAGWRRLLDQPATAESVGVDGAAGGERR